ncbi:MAG: hypothetical protein EBS09_09255 [Flavobacteriia bacterium]|nr:hypothetical protein [Flavobacteriia bacterium]
MAENDKKTAKTTSKKAAKKTVIEENKLFFEDTSLVNEPLITKDSEHKSIEIELEITNPINSEKSIQINEDLDSQELKSKDPITSFSPFDFKKPLYIEIHRGNIFHYFASGLITPSKYISNRAFPDLQSIQNDALLVGNGCSNSESEDLVLLEIQISESEKNAFVVSDNFAFLFQPLPTSRIKNIYVKNESVRSTILSDSLVFDGGYIPENLIKVVLPIKLEKNKYDTSENTVLDKLDYTTKVNKFDRTLGLLAFIRNYNLLLSDKTNSYKTLPNHFFYAVQAIDSTFGADIVPNNIISEFYSWLFNDNCPQDKQLLKWLFERLYVFNNFNDSDTKEFESIFNRNSNDLENEKTIRQVFFGLTKNMERKSVLETIESIKSKSALPLYLFSFLRNYANLNSIEIARRDITSVYSPQYGEYAFALLGYFIGYKNLRNSDERISNTNSILKLLGNVPAKPPIKFQHATEFDYLIIELVFNHSFYGKSSPINLSSLSIENISTEKKSINSLENSEYRIRETLLHGKLYQTVSPSDPLADILSLLSKLPKDIPLLSEFGWYCYKLGIKMKPFSLSDVDFSIKSILKIVGYSKDDLIFFIESNRKRIDVEELKTRINLSQKSKEL